MRNTEMNLKRIIHGCLCYIGVIMLEVRAQNAVVNEVMGMPQVSCEMDHIRILTHTRRPFWGRIFTKGRSADPDCSQHYQVGGSMLPELKVKLAKCGMLRERRLNPSPGLMESVVVVVSFHGMFVTKKDRAYAVQCYYEQMRKHKVDHAVTVNEMTTIPLGVIYSEMSRCYYSVHVGHIDGPEARVAEVGQQLYHRWRCEGPPDLKMLVKNCEVSNGYHERFTMIDDVGCAVDPTILPDLTYAADQREAYVAADAFKFSDNSDMLFSCSIALCHAGQNRDRCDQVTPPVCYDRSPSRRSFTTSPIPTAQSFVPNTDAAPQPTSSEPQPHSVIDSSAVSIVFNGGRDGPLSQSTAVANNNRRQARGSGNSSALNRRLHDEIDVHANSLNVLDPSVTSKQLSKLNALVGTTFVLIAVLLCVSGTLLARQLRDEHRRHRLPPMSGTSSLCRSS